MGRLHTQLGPSRSWYVDIYLPMLSSYPYIENVAEQWLIPVLRWPMLDVHQYLIFDHNLIRLSRRTNPTFLATCGPKTCSNQHSSLDPRLLVNSHRQTNDCATYLNEIGVGYRWDGTFLNENGVAEEAACQPKKNGHLEGYCSCETQNHVATYTQSQMDAFEQGMGWFIGTSRPRPVLYGQTFMGTRNE